MNALPDDPSFDQSRAHYRSVAWFWIGVSIAVIIAVAVVFILAAEFGWFHIADGADATLAVT